MLTKEKFHALLRQGPLFLDGATGSNLQKAGMPAGVCPEQWILEHPECLVQLQKSYLHRGSDIVYAPTFSANRIKLTEYGLENRLEEMNRELVGLSKRAIGEYMVEKRNAEFIPFIAGDVTMTGKLLEPLGPLSFDEAVEVYKEQMRVLVASGVDLTEIDLQMLDGASIRIGTVAGIRYCTAINKQQLDDLVSTNGEANVEIGTIIAPTRYVTEAGAFTMEKLDALKASKGFANDAYVKVKATYGYAFDTERINGVDYYVFAGSLENIKEQNQLQENQFQNSKQVINKEKMYIIMFQNQKTA